MSDQGPAERLELVTDRSRADFSVESGRLTRLMFGERELIVDGWAEPPGSWFWGAFVMAPWTSLIRDGAFEFDGARHRLAVDDGRHAVHGLTWKLPWRIEHDRLSCDLTEGWSFGGRVMIIPELGPDRLRVRLRVEAGELSMPAAIGWHPWFVRQLPGSGPARLSMSGPVWRQHRDDREVPTGRWESVRREEQDFNDCLWMAGPTTVAWPGAGAITIGHDSPFATVYTTDPRGVCVEPVTSPAERMDHRLAPGDAIELTIDVAWQDEAPCPEPVGGPTTEKGRS